MTEAEEGPMGRKYPIVRTVRLAEEHDQILRALGAQEDRDISNLIRRLITKHAKPALVEESEPDPPQAA
jgi:hypothetical protein